MEENEKTEFKIKKKGKDEVLEEKNIFTREPIYHTCQFCNKAVLTEIVHESTWIGIGLSIIFFLVFKIYSLILIALIIPLTQKTVHSCPNCINIVGVHSFYDLLSMTDKVISYQIGNFAIIVNRKQLLGIFLFFLFILGFYFIFHNLSFERDENFLNVDWDYYKSICGKERYIENPTQADIICTKQFKYHNIFWKGISCLINLGWVIRVDYDDRLFTRYRVSVLIKMEKNDYEDADIYLKFDDHYYHKFKPTFLNMTRGDFVSFNATIMFTGNKQHVSVFEGFGIEQEAGHIYIQPHIHHNGRYSISEDKHANKDESLYPELPNLVIDKDVDIHQHETTH